MDDHSSKGEQALDTAINIVRGLLTPDYYGEITLTCKVQAGMVESVDLTTKKKIRPE